MGLLHGHYLKNHSKGLTLTHHFVHLFKLLRGKKKTAGTDEPICKAEIETEHRKQMLWTLRREGRSDTLGDWD